MKLKFCPKGLSRNQDWETASIWECEEYGVSIHKYAGCGDNLYLTCTDLGFSKYDLKTDDFDLAVAKAKWCVKKRLESLSIKFDGFVNSEGYEKAI